MRSQVGREEGPGSKCCSWAWGGCQIVWSFVFAKLTTFAVVCSIPWRFFFSTFCFVIEWDEGAFAHWQGPPWSRWVFPWRGDGWTGWVVQNCKEKLTVGSDGLEKGLRCHLFFLIQTKQTCRDRSGWITGSGERRANQNSPRLTLLRSRRKSQTSIVNTWREKWENISEKIRVWIEFLYFWVFTWRQNRFYEFHPFVKVV